MAEEVAPTRKRMDVDFDGHSPSTRWVVIDVNNDPLGVPNVYLGADPARPYVSIGLPHGIRRWEFMLFDDEPSERVEDDAFITHLLETSLIPNSRLYLINGCGHWLQTEHPTEFTDQVLHFLKTS